MLHQRVRVIVASALLLALIASGCGGGESTAESGSSTTTAAGTNADDDKRGSSDAALVTRSLSAKWSIDDDDDDAEIIAWDGEVWIRVGDSIRRLDPSTGVADCSVPAEACLVSNGGPITSTEAAGRLWFVDEETNPQPLDYLDKSLIGQSGTANRAALFGGPAVGEGLVVSDDKIWFHTAGTVGAIDPAQPIPNTDPTGTVVEPSYPIPTPPTTTTSQATGAAPMTLVGEEGQLWLVNRMPLAVLPIDPSSGPTSAWITVREGNVLAASPVANGGSLYLRAASGSAAPGATLTIEPDGTTTELVDTDTTEIGVAGGHAWVSRLEGGVWRVDGDDLGDEVENTTGLNPRGFGPPEDDNLWVSHQGAAVLIDPEEMTTSEWVPYADIRRDAGDEFEVQSIREIDGTLYVLGGVGPEEELLLLAYE